MQQITPVVILGMHRSGTSLVSGILEKLGLDMGEDRTGKQWSNPLGHYEDHNFLQLNKDILSSAGGSWKRPPNPQEVEAQRKHFQNRIMMLLEEKKRLHPDTPWGWKDPRSSLTIGLFYPDLEHASLIWCRRRPEAVAQSLLKRNQIPLENGLKLWEIYEDRIQEFIKNNPQQSYLLLQYEEIISDPVSQISKVIDYLELTPDQDQIQQAVDFVLQPAELSRKKKIFRILDWMKIPFRSFRNKLESILPDAK